MTVLDATAVASGVAGGGSADTIRLTSDGGTHPSLTLSSLGVGGRTIVARVKAETAPFAYFRIPYAPNSWGYQVAVFDLIAGTRGYDFWSFGIDPLQISSTITGLGDGWYEIAVGGSDDLGGLTIGAMDDGGTLSFAAAGHSLLVARFAVFPNP